MNNYYRSGQTSRNAKSNCNPTPCPTVDGQRSPLTPVVPFQMFRDGGELSGMPIAMAYVPWQQFTDLYCEDEAFCNGTIFKELRLEFAGRRCRK